MKYIDIDSTYRDRTKSPNPGNFIVDLSQSGTRNTSQTAPDFIIDSFPIHGDGVITFAVGGSAAAPILDVTSSVQNNFYVNYFIEDITLGEFRQVLSYDGTTRIATLVSAFSGGWQDTDAFSIRKTTPFRQATLVGTTTTVATLDGGASTVDNTYVGLYIWFSTTNQVRIVTAYDGALREATLNQPIAAALGAVSYELLLFSRSSFHPIEVDKSASNHQQEICYEVTIIHLIVPSTILSVSNGGTINNYPYIYIEFGNMSGNTISSQRVIHSNSPAATRATFKLPVVDVSNVASNFIKIACDHPPQIMKFNPVGNFFFGVKLPNGEYFTPSVADNMAPSEPNPALQISAMFGYQRVD